MNDSQGFWSYVHKDDEADGGRISKLAKNVADQYEMLTGETINLFLDKDALEWGDDWREKIDGSLTSVAFFIPVMTPRYFMSPECRRELQFFARRATDLGIKDLVLPLLYVEVPSLHDETDQDELFALVRTFQWEDWRELRYSDVVSEDYRRGVSRLANRLVQANRHAEQVDVAEAALLIESGVKEDADESPGLIDRMASAEEALPQWNDTLLGITNEIETIGIIMNEGTSDLNNTSAQGKGFAHRLVIARKISRKMSEPTERIWNLTVDFTSQLHDIDEGIRAFIERVSVELGESPEAKDDVCKFFATVRDLSASTHRSLDSVQDMIDAIQPLENLSRDLRPVFRRLRQGLSVMIEAREVSEAWVNLIEASGIDCEDQCD